MLWLDGSCNYLWGAAFAVWYLFPYVALLKGEDIFRKTVGKWFFAVSGVFMGGYLETISFGLLVITVLIMAVYRFWN